MNLSFFNKYLHPTSKENIYISEKMFFFFFFYVPTYPNKIDEPKIVNYIGYYNYMELGVIIKCYTTYSLENTFI